MALCDGGRLGGRPKREGISVYLQLVHVIVEQKLRQRCRAITLQLENKLKKKWAI